VLAHHLHTLAALIQEQPDRTLAERQVALATSASLATSWRAVKPLGFTLKHGAGIRARSARQRGRARTVGGLDPRPDPTSSFSMKAGSPIARRSAGGRAAPSSRRCG